MGPPPQLINRRRAVPPSTFTFQSMRRARRRCWLAWVALGWLAVHPRLVLAQALPADPATLLTLEQPGLIRQSIYHREILVDPTCKQTLASALAADWSAASDQQWPDALQGCYWLRERIRTPDTLAPILAETGYHSHSELWMMLGDSVVARHTMGNELPLKRRANPVIWVSAYRNTTPLCLRESSLSLKPATTYTIVYRARDPYGASVFGKNAPLRLSFYDAGEMQAASVFHQKASYALAGSLLALLLYHLLQLFVYKSRVNAVFCALLASVLAYVSYENFLLHDLFRGRVFRESVLIVFGELSQVLMFLLTRVILVQKLPGTRAIRVLDVLMVAKLAEMVVWLGCFQLRYAGVEALTPWMSVLPDVFRLSTIACLLIYFGTVALLAFRIRGWATRAILFGNVALTLSVVVYVMQAFLHDYTDFAVVQLFLDAVDPILNYCVEIGIVAMSLCFSLSVAILTKERERDLEQRFVQQLADTEMSALRAQMNPHFLFNGLNSIKLFVIQNRPEEASLYLSKFAGLIRLVLENSKSSLIPLERELEALRLYLELEALRFEGKFSYRIDVDEEVAAELVQVPPTLLQPYVENAIWHGLLQRDAPGGHVAIRIETLGAHRTRFVIEDNGIGRAAALAVKSRSATTHKSLGLKITTDRLRLLRERYGLHAEVLIDDLHESGRPTGTRVTIQLQHIPPEEAKQMRRLPAKPAGSSP